MKKGCLLKSIFILTIFIAVTLYFLKGKYDDFIDSSNTKFSLPFLNTEFYQKLDSIKDSPQKINLKIMLEDAKSGMDYIKDLPSNEIKKISKTFNDIISDSIITEKELNYVREIFKKLKK